MQMRAGFPTSADAVVAMPVDQLAMHILWDLEATGKFIKRADFILDRLREYRKSGGGQTRVYAQGAADLHSPPGLAWAEAWEWLVNRGLVTEDLARGDRGIDHWRISRHGRRIARETDPQAHLRSLALLDTPLHPRIADTVRSLFLQGHYDLAAFESMKHVEIRVRELAKADASDIGVPLMRKAFQRDTGPLTDPVQEGGEKQATSDLFAGAMGTFKNPTSHRQVEFDDPTEASEVVLLADLLLRMLDRRAQSMQSS